MSNHTTLTFVHPALDTGELRVDIACAGDQSKHMPQLIRAIMDALASEVQQIAEEALP